MMNSIISQFRTNLERKKGERNHLLQSIKSEEEKIEKLTQSIEFSKKAQLIIQNTAQETQSKFTIQVSDVVTSALSSVFDDPYKFKLTITPKRNKTEADIKYSRDGYELDPMDGSGLGAVAVGALALRVALLTIQRKIDPRRTQSVLILDEPFIRLKGKDYSGKEGKTYSRKAGQLLKEISEKLNIQIICVSHTDEIIDSADRIFEVDKKRVGKWLVSKMIT
jgi:DNA repair exonuclease SbcCD ATPase subunit